MNMNLPENPSRPQKQQQGFTLIEVLVAVVVLSIGLLGLAGLQTTGLRNNQSAYYASQAAIYANDIFERMRAKGKTDKAIAIVQSIYQR